MVTEKIKLPAFCWMPEILTVNKQANDSKQGANHTAGAESPNGGREGTEGSSLQ